MFDFSTASRVIFGWGKICELDEILNENKKVFLITGQKLPPVDIIKNRLISKGISHVHYIQHNEPTVKNIIDGLEKCKECDCEIVISFGGGSVIDAGKAISAFSTNQGDITEYLEVIGKGKPLINQPLPHIAIPTTAGTGTEVTRNAVITSVEQQVKVSMRHRWLLPVVAIIDPEITISLPPSVTANSGLDTLSQLIEPYVSRKANSLTDIFCIEGIQRVQRSLLKAYKNGSDIDARIDMSFSSLLGGLSLANAGLGAIHGLAGPIGGMFSSPHGAICARLLPFVVGMNIIAMRERDPGNIAIQRYEKVFTLLDIQAESDQKRIDKLINFINKFDIKPLREYGITQQHFTELADMAIRSSSMKANPIQLTKSEVTAILEQAW